LFLQCQSRISELTVGHAAETWYVRRTKITRGRR
jgi:hypothetical protein